MWSYFSNVITWIEAKFKHTSDRVKILKGLDWGRWYADTARSTPNTAFLHDVFGNVTNATDTAGNSWQFTYSANSTLTNEVFTSLRFCDSARETNTLTTPNGATLTRTVTRDPYCRSLTRDCTTRFNNIPVASFAYTFDANSRPVTHNNDRDEIIGASIGTNRIEHAYDNFGRIFGKSHLWVDSFRIYGIMSSF